MSANLLLHPIPDVTKALAGTAYPKIIHPATQDWIDQIYNPIHRLRSVATKNLFELAKQGRQGFHLRCDPYSPFPAASLRPPKVKPKKAKNLTGGEIDYPGLLWVHQQSSPTMAIPWKYCYGWRTRPYMPPKREGAIRWWWQRVACKQSNKANKGHETSSFEQSLEIVRSPHCLRQ